MASELQPPVERSSTIKQVAERHNVSVAFVYKEIAAGKLDAFKIAGTGPMRITESAERAWLQVKPAQGEDQTPAHA